MDKNESTHKFNEISDAKIYSLFGKIFLASFIVLVISVVLILCLHLYTCWCMLFEPRRPFHDDSNNATVPIETIPSSRLDASLVSLLPIFSYNPNTHPENPPNCAICLSDFKEGEMCRMLPKCKHMFHIGCIDMWFNSHTICPLCRSPVESTSEGDNRHTDLSESNFGSSSGLEENQAGREVSSLRRQHSPLVDATIDVPVRNDDFCDELSLSRDSPSSSKFQLSGVSSFKSIIIEEHKGSDSPLSGDD